MTRGWIRWAKEEARTLDLSLPQMFLLGGLEERGEVPVTRYVEMMGASPSATTGLLDGLEEAGFVTRTPDRDDRRQVLIGLTPKGTRLAAQLKAKSLARWATLCKGLPPADLEAAIRVFDRIFARMGPEAILPAAPEPARRPRS